MSTDNDQEYVPIQVTAYRVPEDRNLGVELPTSGRYGPAVLSGKLRQLCRAALTEFDAVMRFGSAWKPDYRLATASLVAAVRWERDQGPADIPDDILAAGLDAPDTYLPMVRMNLLRRPGSLERSEALRIIDDTIQSKDLMRTHAAAQILIAHESS